MENMYPEAAEVIKKYIGDGEKIFSRVGPCGCCCASHGGGKARYQDKAKKQKN